MFFLIYWWLMKEFINIVCWEIIDKIVEEWIILFFFVSVLYILKYENIFF